MRACISPSPSSSSCISKNIEHQWSSMLSMCVCVCVCVCGLTNAAASYFCSIPTRFSSLTTRFYIIIVYELYERVSLMQVHEAIAPAEQCSAFYAGQCSAFYTNAVLEDLCVFERDAFVCV
jgi:hypothetical protein